MEERKVNKPQYENVYVAAEEKEAGHHHHHHDGSSSESDFEEISEDSLLSRMKVVPRRGNDYYQVPCVNNCGEVLDSKTMETHVSESCPLAVIDCDFAGVGCEMKLLRKEMPIHLQEGVAHHLSLQTVKYEEEIKALKAENEDLGKRFKKIEERCDELEKRVNELMFEKLARIAAGANSVPAKTLTVKKHADIRRIHSVEVSANSMVSNRSSSGMQKPRTKISADSQINTVLTEFPRGAEMECPDVVLDDGSYVNEGDFQSSKRRGDKGIYSYIHTNDLVPARPKSPLPKVTPQQTPENHLIIMRNFEKHKKNKDHWVSRPFFTHPQGYMMCLRVSAYGQGRGKGTHLAVGMYLMKGEYDDKLHWPFRSNITIKLLNQQGEDEHFSKTIHGAEGRRDGINIREKFISGWGIHQYKLHGELSPKFLKQDTLKFQVVVDLVKAAQHSSPSVKTEV